jgi:hypothetical protein
LKHFDFSTFDILIISIFFYGEANVDVAVGVSVGIRVGDGVSVGTSVGDGVYVGVAGSGVGVGRLRLTVTRFSTSALSPVRVNLKVTIPFGMLDKFHE